MPVPQPCMSMQRLPSRPWVCLSAFSSTVPKYICGSCFGDIFNFLAEYLGKATLSWRAGTKEG